MDCFKLRPGHSFVYPIIQEVYLTKTKKKRPYYRLDNKGAHFYAVCPECENPIQIIGLFRNTVESGRKPYGKHHRENIPDLAKYNEDDYLHCPYSNLRWKKPVGKRKLNSQFSKDVLRLMYDQYDRIIKILSEDIGIYISVSFAEEMLKCFILDEVWRYRMTTLNNLPWMLGEALPSTSLYGRWLIKDGELQKAIAANCAFASFKDTASEEYVQLSNRDSRYLDVRFYFLKHEKALDGEHHLTESIDMEVVYEGRGIYRKTIQIKPERLSNAIESHMLPRDERYLNVARKLIDTSLFT